MKLKIFSIVVIFFFSRDLFSQKVGDAYALNINNIYLPLNRKGVIADVNIPPNGSGGQFGGHTFLFSGGFFLSGYSNGTLWANAVASATLEEDYLPGNYQTGQNDPRAVLYKLRYDDQPFGQSWQDWKDAVALGADFYDGNEDQVYNPIDLNGNNEWDPNEDCPDLLGDETTWCVYHDAVPSSQRRWDTVEPQGIEIRQTVFAYSTVPLLQNVIFIRYRILNTGTVVSQMDSVYFGIWADPDLGDSQDDLAGCDMQFLGGGYTYNHGADAIYGSNPPCFATKRLSGPEVYIPGVTFVDNNGNGIYDEGIDVPLDTAYTHRGQLLGKIVYPGAQNQVITSAVDYLNGDPTINDPSNKEEARNFMLGLTRLGEMLDPCTWPYGEVRGGVDCSQVDPLFWYLGDPVNNTGWINTYATDQRQMQNIGPFTLKEGKEMEVFIAYAVGQGTDALSAITTSIQNEGYAHFLYLVNFDKSYLVSVDDQPIGNPSEYILRQNYPNPFNPSTRISWQLPVGSWQTLKIYDVLGNEVETLVDEYKPAGTYKVEWNATGLPSGIYFYQLKSNGFVETKKMILIK